MDKKKPTVKQFVVDIKKTDCRTREQAYKYFHEYRENLRYNEPIRWEKIEQKECYIIYYILGKELQETIPTN